MEPANTRQIAYWNEQAGPRWVQYQDRMDVQLAPLGEAVLDRIALVAGERVLDVGCGCGAMTLAAAARVAPRGRAAGIDVSAPMLGHARTRAESAGAANVEFLEADAQTEAFAPGAFDALVSRFGVMFFEAPEAAFANLHGALRPGGRLAFVCWQEPGRNAWVTIPLAAVARHVELPAPPAPGTPGPFAFSDAERVRRILTAGGFAEVEVEALEGSISLAGAETAEEAAELMIEIGPASRALQDVGADDALCRRVAESAAEALAPFVGEDGVRAPYAAWLVTARA